MMAGQMVDSMEDKKVEMTADQMVDSTDSYWGHMKEQQKVVSLE